jgi:DNA repair exonuclease SbcCD nuclease subunit
MISFLHLADIHLGTNQYNSPGETRKKDFFYSFYDVIKKHAIARKVNFVIIAGDLFDKNRIDPGTLNQAILVFQELKEHNIPAFVIEGNHDSQFGRETISWLQFLGEHGYIQFIKPDFKDDKVIFSPPSEDKKYSGYYIINDHVRIAGTQWLGANTASTIPQIVEGLDAIGDYPFTILMMHAGLEGYLAGYGTLSKAAIEPLKPYVNYLALGHIHLRYNYDNWVFNPGSLEACNFLEYFDPHGAIYTEIDSNNQVSYEFVEAYQQREFIRLKVDISRCNTASEALSLIESTVETTRKERDDLPVVEITIDGGLNFKRSDLNVDNIKAISKNHLEALVTNVKYFARPKEYAIGADLSIKNTRETIEKTVIYDMLSSYNNLKENKKDYSDIIINLKNMVLDSETNDNMLKYLKNNLPELKGTDADN